VENSKNYSKYRNGIVVPAAICAVMFLSLFFYSTLTSPNQEIYLSKSLYSYAVIVLVSYISSLILFYLSIFRYYFSSSYQDNNPRSFLYQLQLPYSIGKYKVIFLVCAIGYFVFFAFLSNIFI